uniref:Speckle-type POZ protein n=1 Tax=Lygus hesperus TaxID=30085 RepID=A0A146L255_LYGHE
MSEMDPFNQVFGRLHDFMRQGVFTDLVFLVDNSTFTAHKVVLAACSSAFRYMFSEMENSANNQVLIPDVNAETFSVFLDFLYRKDVNLEKARADQLLSLADQYDVEDLAKLCDDSLEASLNVENAVDVLMLADSYERADLKLKVSRFIEKRRNSVYSCGGWEKLEDNFELVKEILGNFFEKEPCPKELYQEDSTAKKTWTVLNYSWISEEGAVRRLEKSYPAKLELSIHGFHYCFRVSLVHMCCQIAVKLCLVHQDGAPIVIEVTRTNNCRLSSVTKMCIEPCQWESNPEKTLSIFISGFDLITYPFDLTVSLKIPQADMLFSPRKPLRLSPDAKLVVENDVIFICKRILAEKSDFFRRLFATAEVQEFEVHDIPLETLKKLVSFMNSDSMPSPDEVNLNLLRGAVKLKLEGLIAHCVSILKTKMTISNASEMSAAAEQLCLDQLENAAKEFIVKRAEVIVKSNKLHLFKNNRAAMKELFLKGGCLK